MKLYLIPMDKSVKTNNLTEVTNPVYFERGNIPTSDGLFSTEIFGSDIRSRKRTFAYIDLKTHFIHPEVYKLLKRLDRRIVNIASGLGKYIIDKQGQIVEDENGKSGLEWLYANWDRIKFKKNDSYMRNERIDLLTAHPKSTIFCTKWIVIPPFTRDVNLQQVGSGQVKIHALNDLYSKLIRNSKMVMSESEFDFTLERIRFQTQQTLEEIYNHFKDKLDGKHGLIRKQLLGRSTTNATITVITNPRISEVKKVDEEFINLDRIGVPVQQLSKQFAPFVLYHIRQFFLNEFELSGEKHPVYKKGELIYYRLNEPMMYFNEEFIKKRLEVFNNTPESRFDIVEVPVIDDKGEERMLPAVFTGKYAYEDASIINRPLTWMDVIYQAVYAATIDKYVHVTRHPVSDKFSSFLAKPTVLSTMQTDTVVINDKVYDRYPRVLFDLPPARIGTYFVESVSFSNTFTIGLGADYDGDTVIVKGIWSQQALNEAFKSSNSKQHIIDVSGNNTRRIINECIQCLYNLTK